MTEQTPPVDPQFPVDPAGNPDDTTPAPADQVNTPAEPAPVEVDSAPFLVRSSVDGVDRYGFAVAVTEVDYEIPATKPGEDPERVHYDHLTVAWFDGTVGTVRADDVDRPELS